MAKKIVEYKYKHRYHKVLKVEVPTEHGLAGASPRFRKPIHACLVFDQYSGKLEGHITDLGRKSGEDLLMEESYLRLFLDNPGKMRDLKSGSAKSKAVPLSEKKAGKAKRSKSKSSSIEKSVKANRTKRAAAKSNKMGAVSSSSKNLQNSNKRPTSYSVGSGISKFFNNYQPTGKFPLLYYIVDYRLNNVISVGMDGI